MLRKTLDDGTTYTLDPLTGQWTGQFGAFTTRSKDRDTVEAKLKAHRAKLAPVTPKTKPLVPKAPSRVTEVAMVDATGRLVAHTVRLGWTAGDGDKPPRITVDAIQDSAGWKRLSAHDTQRMHILDAEALEIEDLAWLKAKAVEQAVLKRFEPAQAQLADLFEAQREDLSQFVTVRDRDYASQTTFERLQLQASGSRMTTHGSGQLNHAVVTPGLAHVATPASVGVQPEDVAGWQDQSDGSMLREGNGLTVRLTLAPGDDAFRTVRYGLTEVTAQGERSLFEGRDLAIALRLGEATVALGNAPVQTVWEHRAPWRNANRYEGGSFRALGGVLAWPEPVQLWGTVGLRMSIPGRGMPENLLGYLRQGPQDGHPVWTHVSESPQKATHDLAYTAATPEIHRLMSLVQGLIAARHTALAQAQGLTTDSLDRSTSRSDIAPQRMTQAALRLAYAAAEEAAEGEELRGAPVAATQRLLDRLSEQAMREPALVAFDAHCAHAVTQAQQIAWPARVDPVAPPVPAPPARSRRRP